MSNRKSVDIVKRNMQPINDKAFLTVKDAAILLSSSVRTVYKMIENNLLTAIRFSPRKTLVSRLEIDKIFEKGTNPGRISDGAAEFRVKYYYTIAEAENRSGMSGKALYCLLKRNNVTKIKHGKYVYVPKLRIDNMFK